MTLFKKYLVAITLLFLALPTLAQADPGEIPNQTLPLPTDALWAIVASGLVPLAAYLVNHYGPHTDEKLKGIVLGVLGIVASGIAQAITAGHVGFNSTTLQYVVIGLIGSYGSHALVWKPSTIAQALGAGSNVQDNPAK